MKRTFCCRYAFGLGCAAQGLIFIRGVNGAIVPATLSFGLFCMTASINKNGLLDGKVAVVTGASRGIGRTLCFNA